MQPCPNAKPQKYSRFSLNTYMSLMHCIVSISNQQVSKWPVCEITSSLTRKLLKDAYLQRINYAI